MERCPWCPASMAMPIGDHSLAQAPAGSSAPDHRGDRGALTSDHGALGVQGRALRPRPEPWERARWVCEQRKSPAPSQQSSKSSWRRGHGRQICLCKGREVVWEKESLSRRRDEMGWASSHGWAGEVSSLPLAAKAGSAPPSGAGGDGTAHGPPASPEPRSSCASLCLFATCISASAPGPCPPRGAPRPGYRGSVLRASHTQTSVGGSWGRWGPLNH